jgi:hypothetical protein
LKEKLDDEGEEQKKPDEPKFQAFTGQGVSMSDDQPTVDTQSELYQILAAEYGDDPEMIQGIMMSMQANEASSLDVPDEPAEGTENSVSITLRMPDGSKIGRRFLKSHSLGHIINFVKKGKPGLTTVRLITTFPKKVFDDVAMTIEEAKFSKNESLNVDAK